MASADDTFLLPDRLEPGLGGVQAYWVGLKRGENTIPFWDDVKFSTLTQLCGDVIMITVRGSPAVPLRPYRSGPDAAL